MENQNTPMSQPMVGIEGIKYNTSLTTAHGRIGFRSIGENQFRVRVEPANGETFEFPSNWKTPANPGRNPRYSVVVSGVEALAAALALGAAVLTGGDTTPYREPFQAEVAGISLIESENGDLDVGGAVVFSREDIPSLIAALQSYAAAA